MYDPYTQNAFRVLGLAAETESALLPSAMDPRHLPPLWKVSWLAEPDRSAPAITQAMQALQNSQELLQHYRTWFRKQTLVDQRAFKAIEDGYWEGGAELWKTAAEEGDEGALQNLTVLYHSRALSTSQGTTPVWAYWTRALESCNRLVLRTLDDPVCADLRERIVEDLVTLAHQQASRNSPEDVRLVLDIFRRAGLPQKRRDELEEDLLSLELTRLQHACNKLRDGFPSAFRASDLAERNLESINRALENEILPMLEWLSKAQPGGMLEQQGRKEVALLLRSLSRAVRGKIQNGDMGFMARAVEIAPEGFHSELLEGADAEYETPTPSRPPPAEYLEDTYVVERPEAPPPPRPGSVNPLLVVLILLVLTVVGGVGLLAHRHGQQVAEQRRVLVLKLEETTDQAARLASELASADKELARVQKTIDSIKKPALRKSHEERLEKLQVRHAELTREHREALGQVEALKEELRRTK
ncbi:MAG: hypothetical protein AMXMBFR33_53700 [Candidatus Xenobia bacterium]